ncbi:MAG: endonuclease V [Candidatus Thermoplasmatota archaeon]|nr:endonuclease V [Candidatus Thermoplasmatota archaeon]
MTKAIIGEVPDLWKETYDLVAQVPEGRVTTYGEVARALGDVVASRFVGLAMSMNDDIVRVPCRRVVQSDGSLGGYTGGGPSKKASLLRKEGIRISRGKVLDLEKVFFKDFRTHYPLRALRARQRTLRRHVSLDDAVEEVRKAVGLDVAYAGDRGFAAMVVLDSRTGRILDRKVVEGVAKFPYVPTFLAFREIPLVAHLVEDVDDHTVVFYDGNGILHPERFGIASHFGVAANVPTVGVAKKLLCGKVGGRPRNLVRPVTSDQQLLGHALCKASGGNPVYVSAGHQVSPTRALEASKHLLLHRVPEPTRLAHIEAGAARLSRNNK